MKSIFRVLVLSLILTSCSQPLYYQLVELESDNMKEVDGEVLSSNDDIEVIFNLWNDGGSTSITISNKTNKTIYIKHDECFLIRNGRVIDYYDNAEYSSSSSNTLGASLKGSKLYTSENTNNSNEILSVFSKNISSESTKTKSINRSDKITLILPPNSNRVISGYSLQNNRFSDCDVKSTPFRKESNRDNGISFNVDNTPLDFRILLTYSFQDNFNDKKIFESSAFVKHFSNWLSNDFIIYKDFKECENDRYVESKSYFKEYSPLMYYIKYTNPVGKH